MCRGHSVDTLYCELLFLPRPPAPGDGTDYDTDGDRRYICSLYMYIDIVKDKLWLVENSQYLNDF